MRHLLNLVKPKKRFTVLTTSCHERYQSDMDKINADFYLYRKSPHIKEWKTEYAEIPSNHFILPEQYLPLGIDFDFILSQNKFGAYQELLPIAKKLQCPVITLEHTMPTSNMHPKTIEQMKQMKGHINLYISKFSANQWDDPQGTIIRHCVNTDLFKPMGQNRLNHILTVANDYIGRGPILGFNQYARATKGLPIYPVGDTPGLSKPANSTDELINIYATSRIFLNTSVESPIPKSLLEAASCGCAIVSTNNCDIPSYFEHGINALLANNIKEMRQYLEMLLKDEEFANFLGKNARDTIIKKCSKERFTNDWNNIFNKMYESQLRITNED